jgi:hypothetical protein
MPVTDGRDHAHARREVLDATRLGELALAIAKLRLISAPIRARAAVMRGV